MRSAGGAGPKLVPSAITPVIITRDVDRLVAFYRDLFGAELTMRVPDDGPIFYQGLRIGDTDLGVVANDDAAARGAPSRVLLSIEVADVDATLARVEECGGHAPGVPNDMPWGQRVAHISDPDGNALNLTLDELTFLTRIRPSNSRWRRIRRAQRPDR